MSEEASAPSSEIGVGQKAEQPDLVSCPRCGSERIKRIARVGMLNTYIYPMFGRYPWKCARCGVTSMMNKRTGPRRHRRRSRPTQGDGAETPPRETTSPQ